MIEFTEQDREELMKCEFSETHHESLSGSSIVTKAKLVDIDPDIGITIVAADNPRKFLMCLLGPVGRKARNNEEFTDLETEIHEVMFPFIVSEIRAGLVDAGKHRKMLRSFNIQTGNDPGPDICAFNA